MCVCVCVWIDEFGRVHIGNRHKEKTITSRVQILDEAVSRH